MINRTVFKINDIPRALFFRVLLVAGILFYVFFALVDGPFFTNDTPAYIAMDMSREPLYSLFLAACRWIVPIEGDVYLYVAIILQGILMAVASNSLTKYLASELDLPNIISIGVYMFPYVVSILFRFVAGEPGEQFMYSNAVLTEGITVALHMIFVRFIFEYLRYQSRRSILWSTILCFIGISTRKQMMVWLIVLLIAVMLCNIKKKFVSNLLKSAAIIIIVMVSCILFDRAYNYIVNGQFAGHVNDNRFIATMIFYTAEESDIDCIENEELKQLYLDIYNSAKEQGLLKPDKDEGMGWFDRCYHFVCSYDQLQMRTMYHIIRERMPELEFASEMEKGGQRLDAIISYFNDACLVNNIPRMVSIYIDNILTGFVATISQRNRLLSVYSVFVYLAYFASMVFLHVHGKKEGYTNELKGILLFSYLTLLCIVINVGLVAAVIFCQTRYVIYNMSIFYISFFLMVVYIGKLFFKNTNLCK